MKKHLLLLILFSFFSFIGFGQITTVGIIGSATPGEWTTDIDMIQDANDTAVWTLDVALTVGEAKFRANDDWAINWGSPDFPTGIGVQEGDNIQVSTGGDYFVTFNSVSGAYSFVPNSPIGIIGDATPRGWNEDTNMFKDTTAHGYYIDLDLVVGGAKFRKDDDWTVNWGSPDFPSGVGTQGGDDIVVPNAGHYHITFDTLSGAYEFTAVVLFNSIGLIGDATPGGWDTDTDLTQNPNNGDEWTVDIELIDGVLKFRADHDWTTNWGGGDFPSDTATTGGDDILATAGIYRVSFNTATLIYNFQELADYTTIGIIGDATPGGWGEDTDMIKDENDGTIWRVSIELTAGEAKFRADNDWAINWGGPDFPNGVAVQDGANIPVEAGRYNVTFNSLSGEYSFELFVVYDEVSLVGKDGPFGQWPDDTGTLDFYLTVDPSDDQLWTGTGIALTTSDTSAGDSGVKFRANTDWDVNWGPDSLKLEYFPSGLGIQDGENIWCVEGVYDVSLNTQSGEYLFSPESGTDKVLTPSEINVYPNPATNKDLFVDLEKLDFSGTISVKIYNMNGSLLSTQKLNASKTISVNIENLTAGNYLLQLTNDKYVIGKRFIVIK